MELALNGDGIDELGGLVLRSAVAPPHARYGTSQENTG
jgi:hypothetical protein